MFVKLKSRKNLSYAKYKEKTKKAKLDKKKQKEKKESNTFKRGML